MKKLAILILICVGFITHNVNAQSVGVYGPNYSIENDESQWSFGGEGHVFKMNYTLFGKSYARGVWYGSAGYALGMYLSNNRVGWGIVGSVLAVNVPILLDGNFNKEEILVGQNLGALTVSAGFTIYINSTRNGKMSWSLPYQFRKHN